MAFPHAGDPELRAAVERLLRDTDLTMVAIGAQLGVSPKTVSSWNARAGWRKPTRLSRLSPANWPLPRREAVARLYYEPRNDPQDLAEAIGVKRATGRALFLACGLTLRRATATVAPPPGPLDAENAADGPALNAALRGHVARQIAAFDAALRGTSAAVIDSARVLRDLGGLKRLLDEMPDKPTEKGSEADAEPRGDESDVDAGGPADLPALRAEIARRYELFAGGRPPAGIFGEPAPAPAGGPAP